MKIGILYICTGKYSVFWDSFYKSAEEFLLPNHYKHYFVFTDDNKIKETNNIHIEFAASMGFPLDSLLRYKMFLSIEEKLKSMDYLFFFNSNMKVVESIGEEILPKDIESGLVGVIHPGSYNRAPKYYPYERNRKSSAYIAYNKNENYNYFMGGLNGGSSKKYLELIRECSRNIDSDISNNIMAIYHDESHLNKYLHNRIILCLPPSYGYPEDSNIPFEPKVIILNKIKHAGSYFDKLPRKSYLLRTKLKIKRIISALTWKL